MKTILSLFVTFVSFCSVFGQTNTVPVLFQMQSLTGTVNNRQILVQPDRVDNPLWVGANLVSLYDFTLQPVNGQIVTNLTPWGYTITVDGWPRSAHIVVTNGTGIENAVGLVNPNNYSPLQIFTGPMGLTNLPSYAVTNNYTPMLTLDGYLQQNIGSNNGTPINVEAGTNVVFQVWRYQNYSQIFSGGFSGVPTNTATYATAAEIRGLDNAAQYDPNIGPGGNDAAGTITFKSYGVDASLNFEGGATLVSSQGSEYSSPGAELLTGLLVDNFNRVSIGGFALQADVAQVYAPAWINLWGDYANEYFGTVTPTLFIAPYPVPAGIWTNCIQNDGTNLWWSGNAGVFYPLFHGFNGSGLTNLNAAALLSGLGINGFEVVVTNTTGPHGWTNWYGYGIVTNRTPW